MVSLARGLLWRMRPVENSGSNVLQLGRIVGNFLIPFPCTQVRMQDQPSVLPAIHAHRALFGEGQIKQVGTGKDYYRATNIKAIEALAIKTAGVQR